MSNSIFGIDLPFASKGDFPSLAGATQWLNSEPLTPASLRGKVVVVDFWTYSCINWLRTEPYVRAWADKYKNAGLITIGVHTPEFGFEKNIDNVSWASKNYRIGYPIAIDSDYGVWNAFNNQYWPALYLIDAEGRIRHHQFGEGGYEHTEAVIRQLLKEAGAGDVDPKPTAVEGIGVEAAPDFDSLGTGETYVGYARTDNFASPGGIEEDTAHQYESPAELRLNEWALAGRWKVGREATTSLNPNAHIVFRFRARDVHLVMGSASQNAALRFLVRLDGVAPGDDAGLDVAADGSGSVGRPRLYQLVRQRRPIVERTFEIEFLDPGVEAFSLTFG